MNIGEYSKELKQIFNNDQTIPKPTTKQINLSGEEILPKIFDCIL